MSNILEIFRQVVAQELSRQRSARLGVVSEVFAHTSKDDDNNYEINVRLKHEDLELRKVPMMVSHAGFAAPPRAGDLVLVQFVNGDLNQPVVAGRFYHADERPPLHKEDEVLFEHRFGGDRDKFSHLRFTEKGSIYLQSGVTKPEDNTESKTGLWIDGEKGNLEIKVGEKTKINVNGENGNLEIKVGDKFTITITEGSEIKIKADGKPVKLDCSKLTVTGDVDINGQLVVSDGAMKTTIKGSTIEGG
ncbi:MAG TPA: phage baseplate assembly protein V [Blastocatellia bacterium]|nr:phage baseplate assembly protein V [Blastocatellia bacterium]